MYAPLLWYSLAPDPGQPLHPTALNDFGLTLGAAWGFNAYNPNAYTSAATFDGSGVRYTVILAQAALVELARRAPVLIAQLYQAVRAGQRHHSV